MAVSDKRFVKTWMESDSVTQVATKLGIKKSNVSAKAYVLRARGVALPHKKRGSAVYNTDYLNELIAQYKEA